MCLNIADIPAMARSRETGNLTRLYAQINREKALELKSQAHKSKLPNMEYYRSVVGQFGDHTAQELVNVIANRIKRTKPRG